jgi:hypothetical protein
VAVHFFAPIPLSINDRIHSATLGELKPFLEFVTLDTVDVITARGIVFPVRFLRHGEGDKVGKESADQFVEPES